MTLTSRYLDTVDRVLLRSPTSGSRYDHSKLMIRPAVVRQVTKLARDQHTAASRFGRYAILPSSMAMTSYPDVLPVPVSIPRPSYVPLNFFDAPWGEHDEVERHTQGALCRGIQLGGVDEAKVRRVAAMAAEVLDAVGNLVKVCRPDRGSM